MPHEGVMVLSSSRWAEDNKKRCNGILDCEAHYEVRPISTQSLRVPQHRHIGKSANFHVTELPVFKLMLHNETMGIGGLL
jgi:hypothetical protein